MNINEQTGNRNLLDQPILAVTIMMISISLTKHHTLALAALDL